VATRTRKLAETNKALRRSEERFSKAFHANPVPLILLNGQTQAWVDVNRSLLELTGHAREPMIGPNGVGMKLFAEPANIQAIIRASLTGRPVQQRQLELQPPVGQPLTVLVSAEMFELEKTPHILLSIQDITLRIKMESQLCEAKKMEVVGQIAAGVAHDFNNILTVIQGHTELHLSLGPLEPTLQESLQEIAHAATRAASLVHQLLAFSRKQMLHRRPLDTRAILQQLEPTLRNLVSSNIQVEVHCAENLPAIFADTVNLEQILINLTTNARDAMPQGGQLTITAEPMVADAKYKEHIPGAQLGDFVRFSVTDQGCGMSEAVRRKIFEPFFTTKDIGQGTGLGLSTVYGIVQQHQGWLEVTSEPGVGSVFKFYLPVATEPPTVRR
jgi:PAS domain S-box-containing protein